MMERLHKILAKFLALILLLGLAGGLRGLAQAGLTKIADNVYSYVDVKQASPQNSFGANAGIVVGQDAILVVDTLISSKEAQRFIADIRAISDKPIKYVVNTHYHLDHAWGNSEFVKLGAVVISQAKDREAAIKNGEAALKRAAGYGLSESDMEGTVLAVPTITFNDHLKIDLGGQVVQLIYPKASHTQGSCLVWVPGPKVLFMGDVLFTNFHPFLAEGDLKGWAKALDLAQSLRAAAIIPGHGPISGNRDLRDMKTYLALFDKKARQFGAKIKDPQALAAALKKELPLRAEGEFLIMANLQARYLKK